MKNPVSMAIGIFYLAIALLATIGGIGKALSAEAKQHELRGMFCNTSAQVEEALNLIGQAPLPVIIQYMNRNGEMCVVTYGKNAYIVETPVLVKKIQLRNTDMWIYTGTLVGFIFGDEKKVIDPLPTAFMRLEDILKVKGEDA